MGVYSPFLIPKIDQQPLTTTSNLPTSVKLKNQPVTIATSSTSVLHVQPTNNTNLLYNVLTTHQRSTYQSNVSIRLSKNYGDDRI